MIPIFIATHIFLLFFGIILLFYYAKTGYKIDQKVFETKKKNKTPKGVKIYSIVLIGWIAITLAAFIFLYAA